MEELGISITAIIIAAVVNFIIGFLWYTIIFGKAWAKEMKFDMSVKPPASAMIKGMVLNVMGCFLMAYVLAHNNAAWSFVPGMDQMSVGAKITNSAIFTWLGFYVPSDLNSIAWEQKSWKLFFINTLYHLAMLFDTAAILYLM